LFPFCSLADVLRLRLAGGSPEQQAIAGSTIMGWPGTPLLAGYRDGGQSTKYDPDMTMTARCASATNPVAPGTASVIPPRMRRRSVRFGGISKAGPIRRVVCSTRGTPIVALALFLGSLAVSVRRLHYLDHSGLFLLIGLIPLVGWIFLPFACVRDSVSDNDFEPSPKYPSPAPRQTSDPTHGTAKHGATADEPGPHPIGTGRRLASG